jgi:hypothetical protein
MREALHRQKLTARAPRLEEIHSRVAAQIEEIAEKTNSSIAMSVADRCGGLFLSRSR